MRRRKLPKDTRYRRVKQIIRELDRLSIPQRTNEPIMLYWEWSDMVRRYPYTVKELEIGAELANKYGVASVSRTPIKPYPGDERYFRMMYECSEIDGVKFKYNYISSLDYLKSLHTTWTVVNIEATVDSRLTTMIKFKRKGRVMRPLTMEEQQKRSDLLTELRHVSRKDYKRYMYYKNKE